MHINTKLNSYCAGVGRCIYESTCKDWPAENRDERCLQVIEKLVQQSIDKFGYERQIVDDEDWELRKWFYIHDEGTKESEGEIHSVKIGKHGKIKGGKQLALEKGEQAEVQVKNPKYLDLQNEIKNMKTLKRNLSTKAEEGEDMLAKIESKVDIITHAHAVVLAPKFQE